MLGRGTQKVVAQGGKVGGVWDDGLHNGVRSVHVGKSDACVTYVKFEYVDDMEVKSHDEHGIIDHQPDEFVIHYPKEYITSVEGTYAQPDSTTVITSLVFKTSLGRTSQNFGNTRFVLANNGRKLVGFHGRNGDALDALGAYFESDSSSFPNKVEAQGGPGGCVWDHGVYNDVRKVYVGGDGACITRIMVDYVKDGEPENKESRAACVSNEELQEFLLDPNEYIISVEGTYGTVPRCGGHVVITSLAFTTSTGRTSLTFGATKFVLEDNGRRLVGFHGRSGAALYAIGAYFA